MENIEWITLFACVGLLLWLFPSVCVYVMGTRKAEIPHGWMAFFPILNIYYFCRIARKSFLLLIFPVLLPVLFLKFLPQKEGMLPLIMVGVLLLGFLFVILYGINICVGVAKACQKSLLWGALLVWPMTSFVSLFYLAFSKTESKGTILGVLVFVFTTLPFFALPFVLDSHRESLEGIEPFTKKWTFQLETLSGNYEYRVKKAFANRKKKGSSLFELMTKEETFFSYTNEKGQEIYVDSLDKVPEQYVDQIEKMNSKTMQGDVTFLNTKEEGGLLNDMQEKIKREEMMEGKHYEIMIYSYDADPKLPSWRTELDQLNLPYKVLDVVLNPHYARRLKEKLGLNPDKKYDNIQFPILQVNGVIVSPPSNEASEKSLQEMILSAPQ